MWSATRERVVAGTVCGCSCWCFSRAIYVKSVRRADILTFIRCFGAAKSSTSAGAPSHSQSGQSPLVSSQNPHSARLATRRGGMSDVIFCMKSVKRGTRRIRSKTVRNLLSLAYYRFEMFLRHKAHEAGVAVISISEAYTTKTVSWTGEVLENVGGASVIVGSDGERMDRDYNGARGIYLRAPRAWMTHVSAEM